MSPTQIRSTASLIRRGRGVLYFASEAVDATNLKLLSAEDSLDDDILATLSDQSVFVYSCPAGLGKLTVVNADLEACEWSRHSSFLPIVNELADDLLSSSSLARLSLTGLPLVSVLPGEVASVDGLVVKQGDVTQSEATVGQLAASGEGVVWSCKELPGPDIFEIQKDGQAVFALASNLAPEESDLRTLDASLLTDRLSGGRDLSGILA